jgi:hypothetical protein
MTRAATIRKPADPKGRVDIGVVRLVAAAVGLALDKRPDLVARLESGSRLPVRSYCAQVASNPDVAAEISREAGKLLRALGGKKQRRLR